MNQLKTLYYKFRILSFLEGKWQEYIINSRPKCYIFLAADYGNLGDVAITLAQKRFLKEHFNGHDVVEVHATQTLRALKTIKKKLSSEDIITIVGGGNMGDIYGDIELLRLLIVKSFKNNRIILFPQTIDYSESKDARWLTRLSQRVYSGHGNLTMFAREQHSYETMIQLYPSVKIALVPDIVMGLDERDNSVAREAIVTFCLRDDLEKANNSSILQDIKIQVHNANLPIEHYDTHIGPGRFTDIEKYQALQKIWAQFRKSKFVVTDRLHGMIFAYITGTPAIVLPNSNFKITECYEWIKDCGYIILVSKGCDHVNIQNFLYHPNKKDRAALLNINRALEKLL